MKARNNVVEDHPNWRDPSHGGYANLGRLRLHYFQCSKFWPLLAVTIVLLQTCSPKNANDEISLGPRTVLTIRCI